MLEVDEASPPVKAEIFTIDVSIIVRIIMKKIKMKINLDPSIPIFPCALATSIQIHIITHMFLSDTCEFGVLNLMRGDWNHVNAFIKPGG